MAKAHAHNAPTQARQEVVAPDVEQEAHDREEGEQRNREEGVVIDHAREAGGEGQAAKGRERPRRADEHPHRLQGQVGEEDGQHHSRHRQREPEVAQSSDQRPGTAVRSPRFRTRCAAGRPDRCTGSARGRGRRSRDRCPSRIGPSATARESRPSTRPGSPPPRRSATAKKNAPTGGTINVTHLRRARRRRSLAARVVCSPVYGFAGRLRCHHPGRGAQRRIVQGRRCHALAGFRALHLGVVRPVELATASRRGHGSAGPQSGPGDPGGIRVNAQTEVGSSDRRQCAAAAPAASRA